MMSRFTIEVQWCVSEINGRNAEKVNRVAMGKTVDEVFEQTIESLENEYQTSFSVETYSKGNALRRTERLYNNHKHVGLICVYLRTP